MGRKLGKAVSSVHWLLLATMVAVELLMSFSFLGYFHIEPISITIAYIPVLIAGALGGPAESLVVGCAFGLASMWKASATYVMDFDQLFSPFLSGHPWESLFLSVGARALFGLAVGLLYLPARKGKLVPLWVTLVSLAGSTIHAALVYTCLWVFFPETGYRPWDALARFTSPSDLLTSLLTAVVVLLLFLGVRSRRWQSFTARMRRAMAVHMPERYNIVALAVAVAVMLVSGVAISLYFVQRMDQVLTINGIELSDDAYSDLTHLQLQFLLGLLSMALLVVLFMIFIRRYATFKAYEGTLDPLTGLMTRRAFFQTSSRVLREQQPQGGYFLMVDLDHLKEINDTFGHPEGDRVIRQVGQCLKDSFGEQALAARMGGDEFALLLWEPISRQELEVALRHFTEKIHGLTWGDGRPVSCSAGPCPSPGPAPRRSCTGTRTSSSTPPSKTAGTSTSSANPSSNPKRGQTPSSACPLCSFLPSRLPVGLALRNPPPCPPPVRGQSYNPYLCSTGGGSIFYNLIPRGEALPPPLDNPPDDRALLHKADSPQ